MAESYYSARSRRDPDWRERQLAEAADRYEAAMRADPEHVRQWSRDYRARLRRHSLTITQLAERAAVPHAGADLRAVLGQEVEAGRRVELVQGRYYRLNGGLPADVVSALAALHLPEPEPTTGGRRPARLGPPAGAVAASWPDLGHPTRTRVGSLPTRRGGLGLAGQKGAGEDGGGR